MDYSHEHETHDKKVVTQINKIITFIFTYILLKMQKEKSAYKYQNAKIKYFKNQKRIACKLRKNPAILLVEISL